MRGEVLHVIRRLHNAVAEARAAGYLGTDILGSGFDLDIVVHAGAGAYICGEETALLDSLEGFRGQPRLKPPFPAVAGLYACPTVVNNVESIATVPYIVKHGAQDFAAMGTERSKGFGIFSLSGHVTAGKRGLEPRLAAVTLERIQQRGLLAADVGARARVHHDVQVEPGAEDVGAQVAGVVASGTACVQPPDHVQHLAADVDEGQVGPDGVGRDDMPSMSACGLPSSAVCPCRRPARTRRR